MTFRRRVVKKNGKKRGGFWSKVHGHMGGFTKAMSMASTALATARALKAFINTEVFNFDLNFVSATQGTAFTLTRLSGLAEGDDDGNRTGRSIKAHSLLIRGAFTINSASTTRAMIRVIVFIDFHYNGTAPVAGDVLDQAIGSTVTQYRNIETRNAKRFKVLQDRRYNLSANGVHQVAYKFYKKLGHHIKYGGTTAADADGLSGQLYFMICSSESVNLPSVEWVSRLRYIDN